MQPALNMLPLKIQELSCLPIEGRTDMGARIHISVNLFPPPYDHNRELGSAALQQEGRGTGIFKIVERAEKLTHAAPPISKSRAQASSSTGITDRRD